MRAHVFVSGRVQGVGFRYFTARHARRLHLAGYVQNLPDGRVEVVADGDRSALEALVTVLREGPAGSAVRDLRVDWSDAPGRLPAWPPRVAPSDEFPQAEAGEFVIR